MRVFGRQKLNSALTLTIAIVSLFTTIAVLMISHRRTKSERPQLPDPDLGFAIRDGVIIYGMDRNGTCSKTIGYDAINMSDAEALGKLRDAAERVGLHQLTTFRRPNVVFRDASDNRSIVFAPTSGSWAHIMYNKNVSQEEYRVGSLVYGSVK